MNPQSIDASAGHASRRAEAVDPLSGIAVGRVLRDRYVLEEQLGAGGRGSVFKARDGFRETLSDTHQCVALKVLHAGGAYSEERLASLRQEFYCAQVLSNGNVVNVHELDRDGDIFFFTMEMLDGEPLRNVLERLRPAAMRRSQALQLIRQLGAGLMHAHERGVVHGDLTPKNVFITREGELRILNFGAAHRAMDSYPTSTTAAYASCEQLEGRPADPRDDLYALACICYELLAGVHPFDFRAATLARDYHVTAVRPPGLSGRQWRALQKGLSWHRAGRSISVRAWMQRLIAARQRVQTSVTPLRDLTQTNVASSSLPWRAAALVFLTASLFAGAFLTQSKSTAVAPAMAQHPAVLPLPTRASLPHASVASDVVATPVSLTDMAEAEAVPAVDTAPAVDAAPALDAPRPMPLVLSVEPSRVSADDHFAEVRLHRSLLQKGGSFSWWTEPGTAKAGVDYVPEAKSIQEFPSGYRSTRLYVKLLPQTLRSQRTYFDVAISEPGHHGRPTVVRRQIWLPMTSSLQARR